MIMWGAEAARPPPGIIPATLRSVLAPVMHAPVSGHGLAGLWCGASASAGGLVAGPRK